MLRRILRELERISLLLERILERLDERNAAPEPVEAGAKDPKAWMEEGLSNILGYQPGKKGEE